MSRRGLAWLLALALVPWVGCGTSEERVSATRSEVEEALRRGDRSRAVASLERLRRSAPQTPEGILELTDLMVRAGEAPHALWILESAVERHPERADLRLHLGQVALLVQDPSGARSALEAIGPDAEEHLASLLLRARAELQLGRREAALALSAEAMQRFPESPEASWARAMLLVEEEKHEEAREVLDDALSRSDLSPDAGRLFEFQRAELDSRAGRHEEAIARLRALVDEDPGDAHAWRGLLQAAAAAGRGADAAAFLEAAAERDPESPLLRGLKAELYVAEGRFDEAEVELLAIVAQHDQPGSRYALARFYAARGEPARAATVLEDALDLHPDAPRLAAYLAEQRIDAGDLAGARETWNRFRRIEPRDPHVEYLRARLLLAEGEAGEAAEILRAVVSETDAGYTQFWLGRALEESGDGRGAARRYGLALIRDRADPAAPAALLRVTAALGDWRSALMAARHLAERAPRDAEAQEALGEILLQLGEWEAAERHARQLVEQRPERVAPALMLARALRGRGEHAGAAQVLEAAEEKLGALPELEVERALGVALAGGLEEGIARLESLAAREPARGEVHRVLGQLLFARGDTEAGRRATDRALELASDDPSPLATRAQYSAARGLWAEARADALRYLAIHPDDASIHFLLGAVEAGAGRRDAAIAAYEGAASLDEAHFAARNNLALLLAERGDLDAALARAQEAHRLRPGDAYGLDTLGSLYLQRGLAERSVHFLERARAADPSLVDARLHLALAYREAGRGDEARRLLEELAADAAVDESWRTRAEEGLAALD
jgi:tetratricopeptide (TPR) repeat protein